MKKLRDISIQYLKGVGPARKRLFQNLGIESVEDFLYFFPRRYDDRTRMVAIAQVKIGEHQTICGKVLTQGSRRSWYTKKHVFEATIDDGGGRIFCVWFNQPYLGQYFRAGKKVVLYGKAEVYKKRIQMISPEYEFIDDKDDQSLNTGRIVPIYPLTRGITQRYLRKSIRSCLNLYKEELLEILPVGLRNKHRLLNIKRSIENIHFPESFKVQEESFRRVSFEEFLLFQISVLKRRMSLVAKQGVAHKINLALINQFKSIFPFPLTGAQGRVINEIAADMQKDTPMLRLLQGDVGSGKTLVALFGCAAAFRNGKQAAIMAPTEILTRQHYENITKMLNAPEPQCPGVPERPKLRTALLAGNLARKERGRVLDNIRSGEVDLVVGTHALISENVTFKNLSFIVIDEQHKFGVRQRALLSAKGVNPDVLVMTATPIPRTLTLTLFGDLDVSTIDEMPPGRGGVQTRLFTHDAAGEAYAHVREKVKEGQQAYVVYPIIEESETLDLKAARVMFEDFKKRTFKDLRVGLIHGQMKREVSDQVMQKFKNHDIDVLVATSVLEVGVDVPNANVMVIEHAERFGLAQLHQLRGRIGRGSQQGLCLLIAEPSTEEGNARLEAILSSTDGFKIAEQDLLIRGPGHYFGRHQHGLNELKFANPATQVDILELARTEANEIVHKDPELKHQENEIFKKVIQERYPGYLKMVMSG